MGRFHLPPDWQLPETIVNRLGDKAGRQRVMAADGHLLLVLHEPPKPAEAERTGRPFWRDREASWRSRGLGDGPQVLSRHIAEFATQIEAMETMWADAETAADHFFLLRTIAPTYRTIRNLHAVLQEARTLATVDRDLINARDAVGELERTIELLHADVKNGLDFTIAHQAEIQAEQAHNMAVASHRLNLMAAVFLPLGTLAAVFGMNLAHGLDGMKSTFLFWGLLITGLLLGIVLAKLIAKKPARCT